MHPRDSMNILASLDAHALANAQADFLPAALAKAEFVQRLLNDEAGRAVIVTFQRRLLTRATSSWYAWTLHTAQYVEHA
jgi:hypothetical protein